MVLLLFQKRNTYGDKVRGIGGLVQYFPLDETSGTTAFDRSGNGYNGVISGATGGQGVTPTGSPAMLFDGINDFVNGFSSGLASAVNFGAYSMGAWVYATSGVMSVATDIYLFGLSTPSTQRALIYKSTTNTLQAYETSNSVTANTNITYTGNTWIHISMSVTRGSPIRFYLNGALSSSSANTNATMIASPQITVARVGSSEQASPTKYWNGYLAHYSFFNRALSASEAALLARAT